MHRLWILFPQVNGNRLCTATEIIHSISPANTQSCGYFCTSHPQVLHSDRGANGGVVQIWPPGSGWRRGSALIRRSPDVTPLVRCCSRGGPWAALGAPLAAACSLGVSLALVSSSVPVSATSMVRVRITNRGDAAGQRVRITNRGDAAGQLWAFPGTGGRHGEGVSPGAPSGPGPAGGARRAKLARHTSE
jgi:hypothetical protein